MRILNVSRELDKNARWPEAVNRHYFGHRLAVLEC